MNSISVPELCLVVLIGPTGSGKSTFARKHFNRTEVISSDFCRGLVADDENAQDATNDAFDVLRYIAAKRLSRGRLTVIDATNVQQESRRPLVQLAREHDVLPVAIVLNLPHKICYERNRSRPDRDFGPHVVRNHCLQLRRSLRTLRREGFRYTYVLDDVEQVEAAQVSRQKLWNDRREDCGPFDIIGDVHGCYDELVELLGNLGYGFEPQSDGFIIEHEVAAPRGRKLIFVGDLVDRGPKVSEVLDLVMRLVSSGQALCVPGNHDVKLMRKLRGAQVQVAHGLAESLRQLETKPPEFRTQVADFIDSLVSHYVLDAGKLVVAHAGMKQQYIGRASARVRDFALYGDTTGETDEVGLPVRLDWAAEYRGEAAIVYGHTPVPVPEWLNNTINIDTGCVFGGKLSALRWPEREIVSVRAQQTYAESSRPFLLEPELAHARSSQQVHDDVLDMDDVRGKRIIHTELLHSVTIREENALAALEVISRFGTQPKWMIYLPPTMSPSETSTQSGLLEHPHEAFDYFASRGVGDVICQQKHMGSRAIVIVCKAPAAARERFGVLEDTLGVIYTRTGRQFFEDRSIERALLERVRLAAERSGLFAELNTDWLCLDCELMPWSAKALELLRTQYAPVGSAASAALMEALRSLQDSITQRPELSNSLQPLRDRVATRLEDAKRYVQAYGRYCWSVRSIDELRVAPFHLLASAHAVHIDRDHNWHMRIMARLAQHDATVVSTEHRVVQLRDPESRQAAVQWWHSYTEGGGEGMVVKPLSFIARDRRGLLQPALKCRGREYLRIIYGPEYTEEKNLTRLRQRALGRKRSIALRQFSLGIEALHRFVRREPLRRWHECVLGVLALESEPVDPRL